MSVDAEMNTRWLKAVSCMSLAVAVGYLLDYALHGEVTSDGVVVFLLMLLVAFEFDKLLRERDRRRREEMERRGVSE